jgi:hypothetical protein
MYRATRKIRDQRFNLCLARFFGEMPLNQGFHLPFRYFLSSGQQSFLLAGHRFQLVIV